MDLLILLSLSLFAGFLGALLGLGGGIIIVPTLTLFFGVDIRYAIAASLICVVATSAGAAAGFLKERLTNLRLAVLLEVGTVTGAIAGFLITGLIDASTLFIIFSFFLLFTAATMLRKRDENQIHRNHPWSESLGLASSYFDQNGKEIHYNVGRVPYGLGVMFFAGVLSAILGIGSGIFKVMAMDGAMKLPIKVSSATSNFMIGVTAAASAGAYLMRGDVRPEIAAPVSLGVILGSWLGARAMPKMPAQTIRKIFVVVLVLVSIQMFIKGIQ